MSNSVSATYVIDLTFDSGIQIATKRLTDISDFVNELGHPGIKVCSSKNSIIIQDKEVIFGVEVLMVKGQMDKHIQGQIVSQFKVWQELRTFSLVVKAELHCLMDSQIFLVEQKESRNIPTRSLVVGMFNSMFGSNQRIDRVIYIYDHSDYVFMPTSTWNDDGNFLIFETPNDGKTPSIINCTKVNTRERIFWFQTPMQESFNNIRVTVMNTIDPRDENVYKGDRYRLLF